MLNVNDSSSMTPAMVDGISRSKNKSLSDVALHKIKVDKVKLAPKNASFVSVSSSPNLDYARSLVSRELVFDQYIDSRLAYWYESKKATGGLIPKIDLVATNQEESKTLKQDSNLASANNKKKIKFKKSRSKSLTRQGIRGLFKYASLAAISFAFFYVIFNYPVVKVQSQYFYNQLVEAKSKSSNHNTALVKTTEPTQAAVLQTIKNTTTNNNTNFNVAQSAPAGNRILIPSINVEAPIVFEPSREEEAYQKALAFGVVHYAGTGMPGEAGNMVIGGHSSSDWWRPGDYKFIFVNLDKLKAGDRVEIHYNQKKYIYQIENSKIVEPTDLSVIAPSDYPTLTLFTCTPPGTNWKRLIISARLIEPIPVSSVSATANNKEVKANSSLPGSTTQTNFIAKSIGSIVDIVTKPLNKGTVQEERFALPATIDV